eukprot:5369-Heterococcus_DN1.PRE.2
MKGQVLSEKWSASGTNSSLVVDARHSLLRPEQATQGKLKKHRTAKGDSNSVQFRQIIALSDSASSRALCPIQHHRVQKQPMKD